MGDPGINSGLPIPENNFGKLREDKLVFIGIYGTGVFHGTVPLVKKNSLSV